MPRKPKNKLTKMFDEKAVKKIKPAALITVAEPKVLKKIKNPKSKMAKMHKTMVF